MAKNDRQVAHPGQDVGRRATRTKRQAIAAGDVRRRERERATQVKFCCGERAMAKEAGGGKALEEQRKARCDNGDGGRRAMGNEDDNNGD